MSKRNGYAWRILVTHPTELGFRLYATEEGKLVGKGSPEIARYTCYAEATAMTHSLAEFDDFKRRGLQVKTERYKTKTEEETRQMAKPQVRNRTVTKKIAVTQQSWLSAIL